MRKTFYLLLILVGVVTAGYLIFPKSGKLTTSPKNIASQSKSTDSNKDTLTPTSAAGSETSYDLTLSISSPADKSTVASSAIQVIGKTGPNAEVFVNDVETKADSTGNFFVNISLDEGENNLFIVVNDSLGNYAERELTVYLETTE